MKTLKEIISKMKFKFNLFIRKLKSKKIKEKQNIARIIAEYYLSLTGGIENLHYQKANEEIRDLGISNIEIKNNIIWITLTRPGLLIGRKGENIDNLNIFLSERLKKKIKIYIKEERILDHLFLYYDDGFNEY